MFKKFISIENAYRFMGDRYVILEKIDGSNIQFIFEDGELKYTASRNQIAENFNHSNDIISKPEYQVLFERLKELSKKTTVNIYGEIFSNSIQQNIKYGSPQIRFFAIILGDRYCCFKTLQEIVDNDNLLAPIFGYTNSLEEALKFEVENTKSLLCDDFIEGVIIQPFHYWDETRIYKKKSEKFNEKKSTPKIKEEIDNQDKINELNVLFNSYLTENRLKNVLSHSDNIKTNEIFLEFIKDARDDFKKDVSEDILNSFEKKQLKLIFKFDYKEFIKMYDNINK